MTQAECEVSCVAQQDQLNGWDDVAAQDAFDEELRCLVDATCAEIGEGVCYDPVLWSYDK